MNDAREGSTATRRALLAAGVTGLLAWPLTACDASRTPSSRPSVPGSSPSPSRDQLLVDRAAGTLQGLVARTAYTRRHLTPAEVRRFELPRWRSLHLAQLDRLADDDVTTTVGPLRTPTPWPAMRRQEAAAARSFAADALRAESGSLAGLLAQLAAGVDMLLAATSGTPVPLGVEPGVPHATPTMQVGAMQETLANEHAALYLYGVLGAHTSASRSPSLYAAVDAAYSAHRERRDRLTAMIEDAGEDPVASEPGYAIPSRLGTDQQVAAEGLRLERGSAARYLWLVENSTDDLRSMGVSALRNTAVRELSLRGSPEIFPGAV